MSPELEPKVIELKAPRRIHEQLVVLEEEGLGRWDEDGEWVRCIYIPPEPENDNPPEEDCQ